MNEVRRILGSSRPVRVNVEQTPEVSDHAYAELQKKALTIALRRGLALLARPV